MQGIDVIAWDFDGVLNRNNVTDPFVWVKRFEKDFGISWRTFAREMFTDDYSDVLLGRADLKTLLSRWAQKTGYQGDLDAFLLSWFERDAHPDLELRALMDKLSHTAVRQVIATNNGARRTRYIEEQMQYKKRVDAVFSSGRMGIAKPNAEFFMHITSSLGVRADRMLLVDDHKENIDAAQTMGWRALHFTPSTRKQVIGALEPR
ncbi:Alpha-D-glucose-1-phosphate phosphatase YihX [Pseudovibrio axinellae]|uniref:Alpha-D-glucose-1-phosphate phosphatase YihX n=1 Tax=Pseudovibrio axinellae TaxID=989403 RepID=A0A161XCP7_9HYPH|nr:HAD-IA family hydrolase [Pseudovibrio axinellae]KZL12518.1 Alpha-D-glucose-1-phosphate phosphatase YihX [Pseudovibrio axinellae]SEP68794.1 putative hydrolase of the HAD superfamily [Pseudovibrio axinellae]